MLIVMSGIKEAPATSESAFAPFGSNDSEHEFESSTATPVDEAPTTLVITAEHEPKAAIPQESSVSTPAPSHAFTQSSEVTEAPHLRVEDSPPADAGVSTPRHGCTAKVQRLRRRFSELSIADAGYVDDTATVAPSPLAPPRLPVRHCRPGRYVPTPLIATEPIPYKRRFTDDAMEGVNATETVELMVVDVATSSSLSTDISPNLLPDQPMILDPPVTIPQSHLTEHAADAMDLDDPDYDMEAAPNLPTTSYLPIPPPAPIATLSYVRCAPHSYSSS